MSVRPFDGVEPTIAESAYIDPDSVVIGNVEIGAGSSVWPGTVIRGDINQVKIGEKTNIQDGSVLHVTHASDFFSASPLIIGSRVTVGHKALLHACTIGDDCLVGMGSIVLDGAVLEPKVVLGAGSVVPPGKVLESGYLWLGSPVKKVRALTEKELGYFSYSADYYSKLKDRY